MQSGHDEKMDTEVREILDYYRRLPDRGSQEVIVSMLRELQDVCGWIGPVSSTHLTLPTSDLVKMSGGAAYIKTKIHNTDHG